MHDRGVGGGQARALTFSDSVEKYAGMVNDEDLGDAYRRIGKSFKSQLGQFFVVMIVHKYSKNMRRTTIFTL